MSGLLADIESLAETGGSLSDEIMLDARVPH